MTSKLSQIEKMLFALLRNSLYGGVQTDGIFGHATPSDWNECFQLAKDQGVMALAWDGILKLGIHQSIPLEVKMNWAIAVERCEKRYAHYCQTVDELSTFFASAGITMVQIKGVGFSSCYPVPSHRENGDIDIFTFYSDSRKEAHLESYHYINWLMEQNGINVDTTSSKKHSHFYFRDIPVENHKYLLDNYAINNDIPFEDYFQKMIQPHEVVLNEKFHVHIPSATFNTLFLSRHAAQHYGSGLCLHHLYDWACLLKENGLQIPEEMDNQPLLHFIYAFTLLCNDIFGTDFKIPDERNLADRILKDMLHKPFSLDTMPRNKCGLLIFKVRRMMYLHKFEGVVFGKSLWSTLWFSFKFHIKHPQLIFGKIEQK